MHVAHCCFNISLFCKHFQSNYCVRVTGCTEISQVFKKLQVLDEYRKGKTYVQDKKACNYNTGSLLLYLCVNILGVGKDDMNPSSQNQFHSRYI